MKYLRSSLAILAVGWILIGLLLLPGVLVACDYIDCPGVNLLPFVLAALCIFWLPGVALLAIAYKMGGPGTR